MWFCYDGAYMEFFDRPELAKAKAEENLADCRKDAAIEGWSEDTEEICWGKVMGKVAVISERPTEEDDCVDDWFETVAEMELIQLPPIEPIGCPTPGACSCQPQ